MVSSQGLVSNGMCFVYALLRILASVLAQGWWLLSCWSCGICGRILWCRLIVVVFRPPAAYRRGVHPCSWQSVPGLTHCRL